MGRVPQAEPEERSSEHALARIETSNKDRLPFLGGRSVYDIDRHDLLDLLSRVEQRRASTTAEKCRAWFDQPFRYALVTVEGLEHNPGSDLDIHTGSDAELKIGDANGPVPFTFSFA